VPILLLDLRVVDGRDRPLQIQKSIDFFAYTFNWSFTSGVNGLGLTNWIFKNWIWLFKI